MKTLISALTFVALTQTCFADQQPVTPDQLLQQLRESYEEILALTPEQKELYDEKVAKAQGLAKQVYDHAESTEAQKQIAVTIEAYSVYAATDSDSKFVERYREVVGRLIALHPPGHTSAGEAEIRLIQLDRFPASVSKVHAFVEDMEKFAATYPNHPSAGFTMAIFARELYFADFPAECFHVLDEGIRLFPEDKILQNTKSLYGLVGQPAELTTQTVAGDAFDMSLLEGKVVVLEFWATWCGPCRKLAPQLAELYAKYKDQGVEIVGFSQDFRKEDLEKYLGEHSYPWIQLYEPDASIRQKIAAGYFVSWIPTVFIVGKDGKLEAVGLGSEIELIEKKVVEALARQ